MILRVSCFFFFNSFIIDNSYGFFSPKKYDLLTIAVEYR